MTAASGDPAPQLLDFFGAPVPPATWRYGHVWGGENVPVPQRAALRPIAPWFTRERIERLIIPFLRRRPAGPATDAPGQSAISLRTLDILLMHMAHAHPFAYRVRTPTTERVVLLSNFYANLMASKRGAGVDAVRRQARSYVTGADGIVYPTTIPQLTFIRACWCGGVIYVAAMFLAPITAWKAAARRDHRVRKAAAAGGRTSIMGRQYWRAHRIDARTLPVLFEDTGAPEQYDVVLHPERALPPSQAPRPAVADGVCAFPFGRKRAHLVEPPADQASVAPAASVATSQPDTPPQREGPPATERLGERLSTAVRAFQKSRPRELRLPTTPADAEGPCGAARRERAKRHRAEGTRDDAELIAMAGGGAQSVPRVASRVDAFSGVSRLPCPAGPTPNAMPLASFAVPLVQPTVPEDLAAVRAAACAAFEAVLASAGPCEAPRDPGLAHSDVFVSGWD